MEDVNSAVKVASSLWEQLTHAPSHLLLLVALLCLGMVIKKSPTPNWVIPWALIIVGAVIYPRIASPTHMHPSFREGAELWVLSLYGGLLGAASIVAHMFLRRFAWFQRIETAFVNSFRDEECKAVPPDSDPQKSQ